MKLGICVYVINISMCKLFKMFNFPNPKCGSRLRFCSNRLGCWFQFKKPLNVLAVSLFSLIIIIASLHFFKFRFYLYFHVSNILDWFTLLFGKCVLLWLRSFQRSNVVCISCIEQALDNAAEAKRMYAKFIPKPLSPFRQALKRIHNRLG